MKNILERYLIPLLTAMSLLTGCSADEPGITPEPAPGIVADTYLKLSIATSDTPSGSGFASRAEGDTPVSPTFEYEGPASDNEKIQTMRFIIVDGSGFVEHNVLINQTDKPAVLAETLAYQVSPNDTKTIYLIGNESSLPEAVIKPFQALSKFDRFPSNWAELTLSLPAPSGTTGEDTPPLPLYTADQPIPMTEFHQVEIGGPNIDANGNNVPYEVPLFVTRTAVKFTFNLTINVDDVTKPLVNTIDVGDILINKIADKEFLFPNDTEYKPAKIPVNHDNRTIETYTVPTEAKTVSFPVSWTKGDDIFHYSAGPVYLTETKYIPEGSATNTPYSITLPIDGVNLSAQLPNLPSLPRNTHVVVDIIVDGPLILCEVTLVPYTGVILNPDFGIERPAKPVPTPTE